MTSLHRHLRLFIASWVNEKLPEHTLAIVRLAVGFTYLWFGLLKFPFIPGHSPDEAIIRATLGLYFDAPLLIILAACFETTVGFLLLANIRTQIVGAVLVAHVAFTFAITLLNPGYFFSIGSSGFSLTITGQYIVKNLIVLAAGLVLFSSHPRKDMRHPLALLATVRVGNFLLPAITIDVSRNGLALFIKLPENIDGPPIDDLLASVSLPLTEEALELRCRIVNQVPYAWKDHRGIRIGCRCMDLVDLQGALKPYVRPSGEAILAAMRHFDARIV